jgi:hypothetical protein
MLQLMGSIYSNSYTFQKKNKLGNAEIKFLKTTNSEPDGKVPDAQKTAGIAALDSNEVRTCLLITCRIDKTLCQALSDSIPNGSIMQPASMAA